MASLKQLLGSKNLEIEENNLEKGKIFSYTLGGSCHNMCCGPRFCAPSDGTVVLEIWGAGGSGPKMCCCGGGFGGNSGAYARKTFSLETGAMICGWLGQACANNNADFKGCSEGTCVIFNMDCCGACNSGWGCMCAEGGRGGQSTCSHLCPIFCCLAQCYCATTRGDGCGTLCNVCKDGSGWWGQAYGGDINAPSRISCLTLNSNSPCDICHWQHHLATAPYTFSQGGGTGTTGSELDNSFSRSAGSVMYQAVQGLNGLNRSPGSGMWQAACWASTRSCGCYETQACVYLYPYGMGAPAGVPCNAQRDSGYRGGPGSMRVKFIES